MLRLSAAILAGGRGFFTREEALAAGWTARGIRTQLKRGSWRQLCTGRYVDAGAFALLTPDQQHALTALATGYRRDLVIRRDSAACVHGFAVALTPRFVSTAPRRDVDCDHLMQFGGVWVTDPAATVIDCARFISAREGLAVADSALRLGSVDRSELRDQLVAVPRNGKGVTAARFVVAKADPRAETAFESVSRYEFITAGLPSAELNAWIGNRRVDFLWEQFRLIGEADGVWKYGRTEAEVRASIRAERERQRTLEEAGYDVVRWLWREIWFEPEVVVARVLRKLEEKGYATC